MAEFDRLNDARVRAAAFEWLREQVVRHGDVLPRDLLAQGFELDEIRKPQGQTKVSMAKECDIGG